MVPTLITLAVIAALAASGWWLWTRVRTGSPDDTRPRRGVAKTGGSGSSAAAEVETSPAPATVTDADDPPGSGEPERPEPTLPGHDLRFTVYRPGVAAPGRWYDLLVFMHEFVHPSDELSSELRPEERIEREVRRFLGDMAATYVTATEDAAATVPREGVLTFVVELPGFEVNPARQSVAWHEEIQRVAFRIRADEGTEGRTARGRLTVFHGPVILAEMALVVPVGRGDAAPTTESLVPYRKIFASYARADVEIAQRMGTYAESMGDRHLRDVISLRTGEEWNPGLARLIEEADVFQLFWSWNAMESDWVRREWTHALNLGRPGFVRPVYWEDPFPSRPERGLPPPELGGIHFHRLPSDLVRRGSEPDPAPEEPPPPADPEPRPPPPSSAGRSPTLEVDVAPQPRARRESPEAAGTPSWLRYALPTAAVAVLALGTSTLFMGDGVGSGTGVNPGGAGGEGAAGTDDPVAAGESPADPPPGLILTEVTLDGAPVAAVEVRLEASDGTVRVGTTGADGMVTFADVPPDTVRLTVRGTPAGTRLVESPGELVVGPGDTVRTTLRLQPGGA